MKTIACISAAALTALLSAQLSCGKSSQQGNVEDGPIAKVSWTVSGTPRTVAVNVTGTSGRGLRDYIVHIDNNSGGNSATTDDGGSAIINLFEPEMLGVSVNGVRIASRSRGHYVDKGMEMRIVIKDANAFRRDGKL